jgi:conjugative relaxase-like TrwC/TraI family protein
VGDHPAEATGNWVAARFEHDSARPVAGYAAPQLHTHVVVFKSTRPEAGEIRPVQPRELYKTQQFATAVYRAELAIRLRGLGLPLRTIQKLMGHKSITTTERYAHLSRENFATAVRTLESFVIKSVITRGAVEGLGIAPDVLESR